MQLLQLSIVLLIVLLYFATLRRPKPEASDAKDVAPVAATSDHETAVATSGRDAPAPAPAPAAPQAPLTLDVETTGPCWIEATADAKRIVGRLMDEGNTQSIPLKGDLTLRVGEPATFTFTIGGMKGKSLGEPGKPVTVHISPENYKTFLDR